MTSTGCPLRVDVTRWPFLQRIPGKRRGKYTADVRIAVSYDGAMGGMISEVLVLFEKGGPVMWPLLALSVFSVTFSIERLVFWFSAHRAGRDRWVRLIASRIRAGDEAGARALSSEDRTVYGRMIGAMLESPPGGAMAVEAAERHRPELERFSAALSTIITAAPLLGILGTVTGIIRSFDLLGDTQRIADISEVAGGIAEALITTAFGLVIALVTLFPYMVFRAQSDRCLGAIELIAAARENGADHALNTKSSAPAKGEHKPSDSVGGAPGA